jgi:hypothetical protein
VIPQHFRIGESRIDAGGMNARSSKVLTGCPHHADAGMFGYHVAETARYGFFAQGRSHVQNAGAVGHVGQEQAVENGRRDQIDLVNLSEGIGLNVLNRVMAQSCGIVHQA